MKALRFSTGRTWRDVPRGLLAALVLTLLAHGLMRAWEPPPRALAEDLPPPPGAAVLAAVSLNERQASALASALYLQAFDNQPGVSIPYIHLDYTRVMQWLRVALTLDPVTQYPMMMASQLYAQAPDPARQRVMCDFVHREFLVHPDARWRWLAHCAIMARHRLKDMALALAYAEDIARHAGKASSWARQMRIFLLADMGEAERATVLLGGLLAGNEIKDAREQHFLTERLNTLKGAEKSAEKSTPAPKSR